MLNLRECTLCPRECKVNRSEGEKGFCGCDDKLYVARAALHMWEEPCISGENGSGTVFFSGCPLKCVFCQNSNIADASVGKEITVERLSEIFIELQEKGAHNINLVTPTHYTLHIVEALKRAKAKGLVLPGNIEDSKKVVKYLFEEYGHNIYMSIMSQYTPMERMRASGQFPELCEKLDFDEYDSLIDYAIELGVENAFIQEEDVATESFIPDFNCEGV